MSANPASAVLMPGFVGTELPAWLERRLRDGLGAVCIFGENITSAQQLRALCDAITAANPHALIAIDEEGGDVTRLYFDSGSPYPGNAVLGRIDDEAATEALAATVGAQLRRVGCNLDFAPDIDINSNPDNPVIGVRSFGADPALVARHTAAWIRGLQGTGVAASAKHFPGHGDTAQDSHLALPVVDRSLEELRERELVPFVAAIAAGTRTIMTSHILLPQIDPELPATLSPTILGGLLREELGFEGVIVSDALDMKGASGDIGIAEAAVRAIAAGCDLLCIGTKNTDEQIGEIEKALRDAVATGRLSESRLLAAAGRTRGLATELAGEHPTTPFAGEEIEPSFDLKATVATFDVRESVRVDSVHTIVALDTVTNIAVGSAPWGPEAQVRLREGEPLPPIDGQIVLVGKDNHRFAWVRALADGARARDESTIVVDMGWPAEDRHYADIATFGASKHVGAALEAWLEEAQ